MECKASFFGIFVIVLKVFLALFTLQFSFFSKSATLALLEKPFLTFKKYYDLLNEKPFNLGIFVIVQNQF